MDKRHGLRSSRSRTEGIFVSALTSGPLMALLGFGVVCLSVPASRFGAGYADIFAIAPPNAWGIVSALVAATGYIGLLRGNKRLWMLAHGFAVFLFSAIAILAAKTFFTSSTGAPTAATTYAALAANAWIRSTDRYRDHFPSA